MREPQRMMSFVYEALPSRVVFRPGALGDLAEEVARLGSRALVLSTPEQRLAMVTVLTRRMWELTGLPVPSYERAAMPGRVRRPA